MKHIYPFFVMNTIVLVAVFLLAVSVTIRQIGVPASASLLYGRISLGDSRGSSEHMSECPSRVGKTIIDQC